MSKQIITEKEYIEIMNKITPIAQLGVKYNEEYWQYHEEKSERKTERYELSFKELIKFYEGYNENLRELIKNEIETFFENSNNTSLKSRLYMIANDELIQYADPELNFITNVNPRIKSLLLSIVTMRDLITSNNSKISDLKELNKNFQELMIKVTKYENQFKNPKKRKKIITETIY